MVSVTFWLSVLIIDLACTLVVHERTGMSGRTWLCVLACVFVVTRIWRAWKQYDLEMAYERLRITMERKGIV